MLGLLWQQTVWCRSLSKVDPKPPTLDEIKAWLRNTRLTIAALGIIYYEHKVFHIRHRCLSQFGSRVNHWSNTDLPSFVFFFLFSLSLSLPVSKFQVKMVTSCQLSRFPPLSNPKQPSPLPRPHPSPCVEVWGWKCYNLLRDRCGADGARDDLQHPLARFCCALSKTISPWVYLGPTNKLWVTKWSFEQCLLLRVYILFLYIIFNMPREDLSGHMLKYGQHQRKHKGAPVLWSEPYLLDRHFIAVITTNILIP